MLVKRTIKKMDFIAKVGISPTTASKLWKDGYVSLEVLDRICEVYDLELSEVVRRKKQEDQ
nr:helix-turn-helix transcriptional regulator [Paenibacillus donghaensis]